MQTFTIPNVLAKDEKSLQNKTVKEFKEALKQSAKEFGGELKEFIVTNGMVTIAVEPEEAAESMFQELKSQGMEAFKKRPLEAFKERLASKRESSKQNAAKN